MPDSNKIITIGLCPAWDKTSKVSAFRRGEHIIVESAALVPAGKALNVSRSLSWMRQKNTAAGLWGKDDYLPMLNLTKPLKYINPAFTVVPGSTRQNITIIESESSRETHLRFPCLLATKPALKKLKIDLSKTVTAESYCVFSGSMPSQFLPEVKSIVQLCSSKGARIILDTSGPALKKLFDTGDIWLVKPNIDELSQLLGKHIPDRTADLVKAGRTLLGKCQTVLISRGKNGAILITKDNAWGAVFAGKAQKVYSTVSAGDYLLAGFIKSLKDSNDLSNALEKAVKAASAKVFGLAGKNSWQDIQSKIKVKIQHLKQIQ